LALAAALSKVDGALHIRADLHLYAFACLLDGHRVANEDRSRGARYNSALRFTSQHPQTIVVVVSADRPASIFQQGKELKNSYDNNLSSRCDLSHAATGMAENDRLRNSRNRIKIPSYSS